MGNKAGKVKVREKAVMSAFEIRGLVSSLNVKNRRGAAWRHLAARPEFSSFFGVCKKGLSLCSSPETLPKPPSHWRKLAPFCTNSGHSLETSRVWIKATAMKAVSAIKLDQVFVPGASENTNHR